ncbi:ABC transporter substrate-binding protein [Rufibacter sediminis]|uniref:ABC transporter substrate-binding protein n=1 Tax=Rufibacter sediminis TaxID=2762756 RepID=A0ABR6VYT4_9BACT|nr:ABC transporter substrate-binding protein [Rufibacter sediminis]MBC3542321.1 ABC transporter substrate-binding protein [Rufibacter sediminis]
MKKYCAKSLSLFFLWLLACSNPSTETAIKVRFSQDPESLHPLSYGNAPALQILNHLYQSLLAVDLDDKSIKPQLATSLPSIRRKDTLSFFTFSIRPEATWDNGSPVTGHDVAFSLKLLHSPLLDNERWRAQYNFIKDIQISSKDPKSFTLVCSGYTPEMKLMVGDFFVLPAHQFDPKGVLSSFSYPQIRQEFDSLAQTSTFKAFAATINKTALVRDTSLVKGSGPYSLASWKAGQAIVLRKKKKWWGQEVKGYVKSLQANPIRLIYQILPDNGAAVLALKAQQIDLMDNVPLVSFLEMRKDKKYQELFHFYSPTSYELVFMGMNGRNPLLEDKRTRLALAHLMDIPQIIRTIQGGLATPTIGIVHPQEKDFYNYDLPPIKFDLQKAKTLLLSSGWKQTPAGWQKMIDGKPRQLKLELLHRAGNTDFENMSLLFQQNARELNIPVTLQALESGQISERLQSRKFDLFFRTLVGNPFSYNLIPILHTSNAGQGGANVTNFGTIETDMLLENIVKEERTAEKAQMLKALQKKTQEESNFVFLYFQQNKIIASKRIDSLLVSGVKPGYDITRSIIKK